MKDPNAAFCRFTPTLASHFSFGKKVDCLNIYYKQQAAAASSVMMKVGW